MSDEDVSGPSHKSILAVFSPNFTKRQNIDKNAIFMDTVAEAEPSSAVNVPHGLIRVGELVLDKSIVIRGEPGAVLEVNGSIHIKNSGN